MILFLFTLLPLIIETVSIIYQGRDVNDFASNILRIVESAKSDSNSKSLTYKGKNVIPFFGAL